jgi:hypothetical protein
VKPFSSNERVREGTKKKIQNKKIKKFLKESKLPNRNIVEFVYLPSNDKKCCVLTKLTWQKE